MPRRKIVRLAYILPALHIGACLVSYTGLIFPKLQYLGFIFTFVLIADLPISLVTYFAVWEFALFAGTWIVVVGTLRWYLIGLTADWISERIKEPQGNQRGSLFPPDKGL